MLADEDASSASAVDSARSSVDTGENFLDDMEVPWGVDEDPEIPWGPEYDGSNTRFQGGRGNLHYFDEVEDFLVSGVYPHRLRADKDKVKKKTLNDFARNVSMSYRLVVDGEGEPILFHKVQPGHRRDSAGDRKADYGWKIVLRKEYAPHVIAQLHARFHYGRDRALFELNREYKINNTYARELLARIKEQCPSCHRRLDMPKSPPDTPITSMDFGERILVDLKQLLRRGYMIVAICHWSSYSWLRYLASKHAEGVADVLEMVFREIRVMRSRWKEASREAEESRQGGVSFPANPEEARTDSSTPFFDISVSQDHKDILKALEEKLARRVRVLQHDRGREFNNKRVRDLGSEHKVAVLLSKAYCPRENGKSESKVKNAFRTLCTEVDKFGGLTDCSTSELQECIASAQDIENHAMHAKTRFSPFMAATRRKSEMETRADGKLSRLIEGDALTPLDVLAMYHRIQMQQFRSAQQLVERAASFTQAADSRMEDFKVGQIVRFKHRAMPHRVPQHGKQEGRIVQIVKDGAKRAIFRVETTGEARKMFNLSCRELQPLPREDPEFKKLLALHAGAKGLKRKATEVAAQEAQEQKNTPNTAKPPDVLLHSAKETTHKSIGGHGRGATGKGKGKAPVPSTASAQPPTAAPCVVFAVVRVGEPQAHAGDFWHYLAEIVEFNAHSNVWKVDPFAVDDSSGSGSAYIAYERVTGALQEIPFDNLRQLPDGVVRPQDESGLRVVIDVDTHLPSYFADHQPDGADVTTGEEWERVEAGRTESMVSPVSIGGQTQHRTCHQTEEGSDSKPKVQRADLADETTSDTGLLIGATWTAARATWKVEGRGSAESRALSGLACDDIPSFMPALELKRSQGKGKDRMEGLAFSEGASNASSQLSARQLQITATWSAAATSEDEGRRGVRGSPLTATTAAGSADDTISVCGFDTGAFCNTAETSRAEGLRGGGVTPAAVAGAESSGDATSACGLNIRSTWTVADASCDGQLPRGGDSTSPSPPAAESAGNTTRVLDLNVVATWTAAHTSRTEVGGRTSLALPRLTPPSLSPPPVLSQPRPLLRFLPVRIPWTQALGCTFVPPPRKEGDT